MPHSIYFCHLLPLGLNMIKWAHYASSYVKTSRSVSSSTIFLKLNYYYYYYYYYFYYYYYSYEVGLYPVNGSQSVSQWVSEWVSQSVSQWVCNIYVDDCGWTVWPIFFKLDKPGLRYHDQELYWFWVTLTNGIKVKYIEKGILLRQQQEFSLR